MRSGFVSIFDNLEENIFNAGYTTKEKGKGTGLGLAISQKIIEKHKGKIEVYSKENEYFVG